MLEVIKPHVYGGKRRKVGDKYEIKTGAHRRLFLALGWVREHYEYQTAVVEPVAAYEFYHTTAMVPVEKPKRRYTRRIKTDDDDE